MIPFEALTCVSRAPLLHTILQCDPVNVAVNVPPPPTDWPAILVTAVIGVVGAFAGAAAGARMAISHSEKARTEDQTRHLRERIAELLFRLDGVRRTVGNYYDDKSTGRTAVTNGDGAETDILVTKAPAETHDATWMACHEVSAVLGYVVLIAPDKLSDLAKLASTRVRALADLVERDFLESEYRTVLTQYEASRADLVHNISPARQPRQQRVGTA